MDIGSATQNWRWPAALGVGAAALLWVVWYFTVAPCTMERAEDGLCNPGIIARFINHQILAQCILLGLAVAAVKGGYDEIMVSRERKRADDAEARLEAERKRVDALYDEWRAQRETEQAERRAQRETEQAERRAQREVEQAERRAQREVEQAEREAVLNTLAQINNTLTQLLAQQRNGRSSQEN